MIRPASLLVILLLAAPLIAAEPAKLLRYPDVHGDAVVFMYAGDLWSVPVIGGSARRITTHDGIEYLPKTSPDGKWIALSAEYEGNMDVYVMPAEGGEPRRLTFHPLADRVTGWTPDGRIVFRSKRSSIVQSYDRLFTVGVEGGFPIELPLPSAGPNSFSPDGTRIAYNPIATESSSGSAIAAARSR
jgi:tricorn protease